MRAGDPARRRGVHVDARPSDSIAIALRTGAELFAGEELLDGSPTITWSEGVPPEDREELDPMSPPAPKLPPDELKEYLRKLNPEDLGRFNP
jgi:bifunctional DNase/RNase